MHHGARTSTFMVGRLFNTTLELKLGGKSQSEAGLKQCREEVGLFYGIGTPQNQVLLKRLRTGSILG